LQYTKKNSNFQIFLKNFLISLSLTVSIKIVEMLLNFNIEEAFGDLCLDLWKYWQSCAEDAVPFALQKTSDVCETSDVWNIFVGGIIICPCKILLIQLLRFWQDCVVGRRCNQVLLQCSMPTIAKE